jgi:hypothetical protein
MLTLIKAFFVIRSICLENIEWTITMDNPEKLAT